MKPANSRRDDAVLDDFLLVINVLEEQVERRDALGQSALNVLPLAGGNDARHEVDGEDALRAARVAIDVEGDALTEEGEVHGMPPAIEFVALKLVEESVEFAVMRQHLATAAEHFIEERLTVVAVKKARFSFCRCDHFATGVWFTPR